MSPSADGVGPYCRGHGGTLLEVLAALTVMSSGMLGIAALYAEGIKSARLSIHRITAVQLVADMAERIRSNARAPQAYAGAAQNYGCSNSGIGCTPNELAADDLFWWRLDIARQLPSGAVGTILRTSSAGGNRFHINIAWPEGGVATPLGYSLSIRVAATAK